MRLIAETGKRQACAPLVPGCERDQRVRVGPAEKELKVESNRSFAQI